MTVTVHPWMWLLVALGDVTLLTFLDRTANMPGQSVLQIRHYQTAKFTSRSFTTNKVSTNHIWSVVSGHIPLSICQIWSYSPCLGQTGHRSKYHLNATLRAVRPMFAKSTPFPSSTPGQTLVWLSPLCPEWRGLGQSCAFPCFPDDKSQNVLVFSLKRIPP